jgi:hypothetical protein
MGSDTALLDHIENIPELQKPMPGGITNVGLSRIRARKRDVFRKRAP